MSGNCNRLPIPCVVGPQLPDFSIWWPDSDIIWARVTADPGGWRLVWRTQLVEYSTCWVMAFGRAQFGEPTIQRSEVIETERVTYPELVYDEPDPGLVPPSYIRVWVTSSTVAILVVPAPACQVVDRVELSVYTDADRESEITGAPFVLYGFGVFQVFDLEPATRYWFTLRLYRGDDSLTLSGPDYTFETMPESLYQTPPVKPELTAEIIGTCEDGYKIRCTWSTSVLAAYYELEAYADAELTVPLGSISLPIRVSPGMTGLALDFDPATHTDAYIRVRGVNAAGPGPWSDVAHVDIIGTFPAAITDADIGTIGFDHQTGMYVIPVSFEFGAGSIPDHVLWRAVCSQTEYFGQVQPTGGSVLVPAAGQWQVSFRAVRGQYCRAWTTEQTVDVPDMSFLSETPSIQLTGVDQDGVHFMVSLGSTQPPNDATVELVIGADSEFNTVLAQRQWTVGNETWPVSDVYEDTDAEVYFRARYQWHGYYGPWCDVRVYIPQGGNEPPAPELESAMYESGTGWRFILAQYEYNGASPDQYGARIVIGEDEDEVWSDTRDFTSSSLAIPTGPEQNVTVTVYPLVRLGTRVVDGEPAEYRSNYGALPFVNVSSSYLARSGSDMVLNLNPGTDQSTSSTNQMRVLVQFPGEGPSEYSVTGRGAATIELPGKGQYWLATVWWQYPSVTPLCFPATVYVPPTPTLSAEATGTTTAHLEFELGTYPIWNQIAGIQAQVLEGETVVWSDTISSSSWVGEVLDLDPGTEYVFKVKITMVNGAIFSYQTGFETPAQSELELRDSITHLFRWRNGYYNFYNVLTDVDVPYLGYRSDPASYVVPYRLYQYDGPKSDVYGAMQYLHVGTAGIPVWNGEDPGAISSGTREITIYAAINASYIYYLANVYENESPDTENTCRAVIGSIAESGFSWYLMLDEIYTRIWFDNDNQKEVVDTFGTVKLKVGGWEVTPGRIWLDRDWSGGLLLVVLRIRGPVGSQGTCDVRLNWNTFNSYFGDDQFLPPSTQHPYEDLSNLIQNSLSWQPTTVVPGRISGSTTDFVFLADHQNAQILPLRNATPIVGDIIIWDRILSGEEVALLLGSKYVYDIDW